MEFHKSSETHGISEEDILHALQNEITSVDLSDDDPLKILVIGPDKTTGLLEVIVLDFGAERFMVIHAMKLRKQFFNLLPNQTEVQHE